MDFVDPIPNDNHENYETIDERGPLFGQREPNQYPGNNKRKRDVLNHGASLTYSGTRVKQKRGDNGVGR